MSYKLETGETRGKAEHLSLNEKELFNILKEQVGRLTAGGHRISGLEFRSFYLTIGLRPKPSETEMDFHNRKAALRLLTSNRGEWGSITQHLVATPVDAIFFSSISGDSMFIDVSNQTGQGLSMSIEEDGDPRVTKRFFYEPRERPAEDSSIITREQRLRFGIFLAQMIEAASKNLSLPIPSS